MDGGISSLRAGDDLPVTIATSSTLVKDFRGKTADKLTTGGWKAAPFIIVNEVAERMAFYAISYNMVIFLVDEMHQDFSDAANNVTNWNGTAFILSIVGSFFADAYIGRFLTILVFSGVYIVGIILLTLTASVGAFRPISCYKDGCPPATAGQKALLFGALYTIAIGMGGIKPNISSFGADQFDEHDPKEAVKKNAFFSWFFFAINLGVLLGTTIVAYIEYNIGWDWGFSMSAIGTAASIIALVSGASSFRHQLPRGSPLTRFLQVVVAACRNHLAGLNFVGEAQGKQHVFLDKAYMESGEASRWKHCTVAQVEEFKSFLRVLPIWASGFGLYISFAQINLFVLQANNMNRRLGRSFVVPPGSVTVFGTLNPLILIPIYERYGVPIFRRFTGHPRGLTSLQRVGVGMAITVPTLVVAAIVEKYRRDSWPDVFSFWWLLPQFFLLGTSEVFGYVGVLEFFYGEATDGTKSLSIALPLTMIGVGNWLSTVLMKMVVRATGGVEKGWIRKDLNDSKLDYYYWVVCVLLSINLGIYLVVAWNYKRIGEMGRISEGTLEEVKGELMEDEKNDG